MCMPQFHPSNYNRILRLIRYDKLYDIFLQNKDK